MPLPAAANVVSQVGTLVVHTAISDIHVSQLGTIVIAAPNPSARASQSGLLVVVQNWVPVTKVHFTDSFLNPAYRTHTTDFFLPGGGLVSRWKLDETGTGADAADSGPKLNYALDINHTTTPATTAPITAPTKFTNPHSRHFPFNSTYLDALPSHSYIRNFTVSAWVRAVDVFNTPIITQMDPAANGWGLMLINARVSYSAYADGISYTIAATEPHFTVAANVWIHAAIVTTPYTRYIYTNGMRSTVTSNDLPGFSTSLHLYIGRNFNNASPILFQGDLDDIRIYTLPLTDDQIQTLAYGTEDPFGVTPTIRTHLTNSQLRFVPFHFTDTLLWTSFTKTHLTDSVIVKMFVQCRTDASLSAAATKAHNTNTVLLGDLVGYWKLDEVGTGQTALDSAPLGANAPDQAGASVDVTTPTPITAPTHFTNTHSRRFPQPPNNWLNAGIQPFHGRTQNFTAACWFRSLTTGLAASPLVTHQNASPTTKGWGLMIGSTPPPGPGKTGLPAGVIAPLLQACTPAGNTQIFADVALQIGTWTHIAGVFSTTSARLFVSGVKQSAILTTMPAASADLPTYLGRDYSGTGGATQIVGDLDDVRIYKVALTDDQISSLAAGYDLVSVTVVTKTYTTDCYKAVPTVTKTHTTEALLAKTYRQHTTDSSTVVRVVFVQRDSWKNGTWIGTYGSQGYALESSGVGEVLPPSLTLIRNFGTPLLWVPTGVHTDPRLLQVPAQPTFSVAGVYYSTGTILLTFLFDDDLAHAVSIFQLDYDRNDRRQHINVYDVDTNALLDGPRASGDFYATAIYQTWNVRGHVRFEITPDTAGSSVESAIFIDPPRSVGGQIHFTGSALILPPVILTHTTNASLRALPSVFAQFVQRDNWRNGINWIGNYGSQGYAIINSAVADVMPPGVSYTNTAGALDTWGTSGLHSDPRFFRDPINLLYSSAGTLYAVGTSSHQFFTFLLDDGHIHAISLCGINIDSPFRRFQIAVYDDDTNTLLDGPREVDDYYTTDVYMTWNVRGHIRFDCIVEVSLASVGALFVDPPRAAVGLNHRTDCYTPIPIVIITKTHTTNSFTIPPATTVTKTHTTNSLLVSVRGPFAQFIWRDTWTNGGWIGHYGSQGYAVYGSGVADLMPPGVSYIVGAFNTYTWAAPGTDTDPRYPQVPGQPTVRVAAGWYSGATGSFTFLLDDDLVHSVALFQLDPDGASRRHHVSVYNNDTNELLDGPRYSGDYNTTAIYLVWNVKGHIRFDITLDGGSNYVTMALFVDPEMPFPGINHSTSAFLSLATVSFVQRDNWRSGSWIGAYGSQGYAVFNSGVPDLMPLEISYVATGGSYVTWVNPVPSSVSRYTQVPGDPTQRFSASYYTSGTESFVFMLGDGREHAVTIHCLQFDDPSRRHQIRVYDNDTNILFDGPRDVGPYYDPAVSMTWNVRGNIRFDCVTTVNYVMVSALFVDPPRTVGGQIHTTDSFLPAPPVIQTHTTDSNLLALPSTFAQFLQRDNWLNGINWIGNYGIQGYALIYAGVTDVMPSGVSYTSSGGTVDTWGTSGVYTEPRFFKNPINTTLSSGGISYAAGTGATQSFTFLLDDGLIHAISLAALNIDTPSRRYHINVYDDVTNTLLDGPRDVGDYYTKDVYMTWNVRGHIRFDCVVDVNLASVAALFVDPPRSVVGVTYTTNCYTSPPTVTLTKTYSTNSLLFSVVSQAHTTDSTVAALPAVFAQFVQRDNWRNGTWISTYGSQGYAVFYSGVEDLMPPSVSYTFTGFSNVIWLPVGVHTDPRLPQVPGQPDKTLAAAYFTTGTGSFTFFLDDGHSHAISLLLLDYDSQSRRYHVNVYDDTSNSLLDGPRASGDYATTAVYLTWNVRGRVRFDVTWDVNNAAVSALFIDAPRSVVGAVHSTNTATALPAGVRPHHTNSLLLGRPVTFVQRDNWRNGFWIDQYGLQGYSVFGSGVPDLIPPLISYTRTDLTFFQWVLPGPATSPQYPQVPGQPDNSVAATWYASTVGSFTFFFADGVAHALSLFMLDHDGGRISRVNVYNDDTNELLDGPRDIGDYATTSVYMTWNVTGNIRFELVVETINATAGAFFIDPPRSVGGAVHNTNTKLGTSPTRTHTTDASIAFAGATFVQRDNWRNGAWIGHYGSQGYMIGLGEPDVLPPGVSISYNLSTTVWYNPNTYTDPRMVQIPSRPGYSGIQVWYGYSDGAILRVYCDDGLPHAVSLLSFAPDFASDLHHYLNVVDDTTGLLLDGPRESGFYNEVDVYLTWNVRGRVRFHIYSETSNVSSTVGLFFDAPRSVGGQTHTTNSSLVTPVVVTHTTDSSIVSTVAATHRTDSQLIPSETAATFVQRDNWRGGAWIDQYGSQGYAVFLSGAPNLMPPQVSYRVAGGKYSWWLPPGTYTDPRLPQVPGQPDKTVASTYATDDVECVFFAFDDHLEHSVSIFSLDYDLGTRRHQIEVYNDKTDELLDGPREPGDQYTNSVYMTWNVRGYVRFELVNDIDGAIATALFIDPPMSIGETFHGTDAVLGTARDHKTDFVLGMILVGSRSRTQRVGTRSLAFGGSP